MCLENEVAFESPFEQKNYLGVFVSDAEAEEQIVLFGWDSSGSPKNGLWYISSASGPRYYYNGWHSWTGETDLDDVLTYVNGDTVVNQDGNLLTLV